MKIIDISWPITPEITGYKDASACSIEQIKQFTTDQVRESRICISSHVGTHVDAPSHFLPTGNTIDQLDLSRLIGTCTVLDLSSVVGAISYQDLKGAGIVKGDIIICKTTNSLRAPTDAFNYDFVFIDQSAAQYLVDSGVKSIGIDYLGIERNQPDHTTHTIFFEHGIPIIEGLRLGDVQAGTYQLYCLPLKVMGLEAAPARAILVT